MERVLLKRVLLAYARYNKTIGYCQGFNVIAALILEVMEYNEETALKVSFLFIIWLILYVAFLGNDHADRKCSSVRLFRSNFARFIGGYGRFA